MFAFQFYDDGAEAEPRHTVRLFFTVVVVVVGLMMVVVVVLVRSE